MAMYIYLFSMLNKYAANAKIATALGSIRASSDTVDFKERQMKQC